MDKELVRLLQALVRIPSVNPALADSPATAGELRLAEFLAGDLKRRGFSVELLEVTHERPNVLARFGPGKPVRSILIEAHMDTQGIHGMTVQPFAAEVRGSRLYGRGACDTKGPMAAALHALDPATLSAAAGAGIQIIFVGAIGEERGNIGAEELVESGFTADEALILEPTDLRIVHAHKGTCWFEVEIQGLAGHGSQPEKGVNAICGAMRAIEELMRLSDEERRARMHPLLGKSTTNIGVIRGGDSINVVPDRCVFEVDRRTLPGDDLASFLARYREALKALQARGVIRGYDVRMGREPRPYETAADSSMILRLKSAVAAAGIEPEAGGVGWYSDAGPFSRVVKDVVVFGPGSIAQAHTADEFIELDSLQKGSAIIRDWLQRAAGELKSGGT